jgi:hypothetical protein
MGTEKIAWGVMEEKEWRARWQRIDKIIPRP